ncbi:hypothetical protein SAY86_019137 [Trapa natans]|uniref:Uncharacterized protein n=1 Tax=Trapa natans TaxID=22666 RepID=A0AAN7LI51_TRANT|nr:hypothetical protein SAY86_019137 [Trapa natans]
MPRDTIVIGDEVAATIIPAAAPVEQGDSKAKDDAAAHRLFLKWDPLVLQNQDEHEDEQEVVPGKIWWDRVGNKHATIGETIEGFSEAWGRFHPSESVTTTEAKKSRGLVGLELLQTGVEASDSAKVTAAGTSGKAQLEDAWEWRDRYCWLCEGFKIGRRFYIRTSMGRKRNRRHSHGFL